jgi:hypothetical protein
MCSGFVTSLETSGGGFRPWFNVTDWAHALSGGWCGDAIHAGFESGW